MPIFILEMHNQTNYKMFAKVRPDGNCVSSMNMANILLDSSKMLTLKLKSLTNKIMFCAEWKFQVVKAESLKNQGIILQFIWRVTVQPDIVDKSFAISNFAIKETLFIHIPHSFIALFLGNGLRLMQISRLVWTQDDHLTVWLHRKPVMSFAVLDRLLGELEARQQNNNEKSTHN